MSDHRVWLDPIGNGVARVSWSADLTRAPFNEAAGAVRREVERALGDLKQARVEALVDPDDEVSLRIATWAGLHREGIMRGIHEGTAGPTDRADRVVLARLETDVPLSESGGFRGLLNSFLPRKRAIAQLLIRDPDERVLMCQLTYKTDWDLPGGVVEVGESPRLAVAREVSEELALDLAVDRLLLTDWLPAWGGWDDAVCLVFDGGVHDTDVLEQVVRQEREIKSVRFCAPDEVRERATDFTARRVEAALASLRGEGPGYTESGR
ncbi:NUDIX domain-containing protein [Nocardioides massiliensis]|uniref:8-oxo-dGTP pyrophosphatase MutT (NUDIX family) n=1 Tax=Nocardioides massiliensis TaxID=1325935 RepID=A0ABT9NTP7_9ACTN|nr:NUDIX hydrolase [Nocardioides massiliensis]MDP9823791.1 8-oxo-dGTP pyrophosphatase MutT (NUDIX family) [Nocardioides massiliensis]